MDKILKDIARSLKSIDDSLKKIERNMRAEVNVNTTDSDDVIEKFGEVFKLASQR